MTSGMLAEISLTKAYSLYLDFCELAQICKNYAIVLHGTNGDMSLCWTLSGPT